MLRNVLRVPVIPIPITRLFKAVLTARACTSKLSTSFLYPVVLEALRATCGPQGPLEWPEKQFSLERKLNTLII